MKKQAIFVLGMHRSGTSALTGMLAHLGAAMPKTLMVAQPENPKGYFESYAIMGLSDEILLAGESRWDDWREMPLSPLAHIYDDKIAAVIKQEFDDAPLIALKDPRICRMVPLWVDGMSADGYEPLAILPYRHAMEVAQSLKARSGMPIAQGLLLWLRHVLDAEYYSRTMRRAFVYMPDLLSDWRSCANSIAEKLQINWPVDLDLASILMKDHLDPDLKRQSLSEELLDSDKLLSGWVRTVFFAIDGLKRNENIPGCQKDLDDVRTALDQAAVLFSPAMRALEVDNQGVKDALNSVQEQLEVTSATALAEAQQITELNQAMANFEREKQELNALANTLETSLTYERQIAVERQQVYDMALARHNETFVASEQKLAHLVSEEQRLQHRISEFEKATAALQEALDHRAAESNVSKQDLLRVEREKDALSASLNTLETNLVYERQMAVERQQVYDMALARRNEAFVGSEQKLASLESEKHAFENKISELERASLLLKEGFETRAAEFEAGKQELIRLEREKDALSASMNTLETSLVYERQMAGERQQVYDIALARQNEILVAREQKLADLVSEKRVFEDKIAGLEKASAALQEAMTIAAAEVVANKQDLVRLEREKDALKASEHTLETSLAYERQMAVERQQVYDVALARQNEILVASEQKLADLVSEKRVFEDKIVEFEKTSVALAHAHEAALSLERQMAVERQQVYEVMHARQTDAFETLRAGAAEAANYARAQTEQLSSLLKASEESRQAEWRELQGRIFALQADCHYAERTIDMNRKRGLGSYLGRVIEKKTLS